MWSHSRRIALVASAAVALWSGPARAQVSSPEQVEADAKAEAPARKPTSAATAKKQQAAAAAAKKRQQAAAAAKKKQAAAAAKKKRAAAKKKLAARTKAKQQAEARKRARRSASAQRGGGGRGDNMPPGWSWPPSATMIAVGHACTSQLDALGVAWKPGDGEPRVALPVVIPSMELGGVKLVSQFRKGPFVMDCHLALALATHLPRLRELGVREVGFSRIYGNTNVIVGGVEKQIRSRHALGLAIDIKWFVDGEGRKAVVLDDYPKADPLLLAVESYLAGSGGFRTVLTPGNDPKSHYDHFHVETKVEYREAP